MNKILLVTIVFLASMLIVATAIPAAAAASGSITGTIMDGTSLPLPNATVTIRSYSGSYAASATTDVAGHYAFTTLTSDLYTIQFAKPGYLTRWNGGATSQNTALPITLNAPDTLTDINATLSLGGGMSGSVTDASGNPVSGATVYASRLLGIGPSYYVSTDATGTYTISGMESGTYYLQFSALNYQTVWYGGALSRFTSTPVVVSAPDTTTAINGQLGVGGSISGTITDAALNPVPNVTVSLHRTTPGDFDSMSTTTDASGNYSFRGIGNGTYYVQAAYAAWYGGATIDAALPITIASPGDVFSGVNIALDTGSGKITGTITDVNDLPLSNASLTLYDSTGTPVSYSYGGSTNSDTNGNFSFSNLKSGDYYIKCFSSGTPETWYGGALTLQAATAIPVTSPGTVSGITIKMGVGSSVGGTVTDATGSPVSGISVSLYDASGNGITGGGTTTDTYGKYIFRGFPVGTYYIQVYPPQSYGLPVWYGGTTSRSLAAPVVIAGPTPVTGINVQVGVGARIAGTVRGPLNNPVQGVTVALFDQSGTNLLYADSDATGAYQFTGIPAGMYFVSFGKAGLSPSWYGNTRTQQAATPIIVTASSVVSGIDGMLALGGRISGTVVDAANAPLSTAYITLYTNDGTAVSSGSTDASGNYSLAGLVDGQYYVKFSSTGLQQLWYGGTLYMQESTPVVISDANYVAGIDAQLGAGGGLSGTISNGNLFLRVSLFDAGGTQVASTRPVDASGYYFFSGLQTGTYYVQANLLLNERAVWYGGLSFQTATPIQVTAPQTVNNIDFSYDITGVNWLDAYTSDYGTVTGSPAGIQCSHEVTSGCSAAYASNETVTLVATPDADAYFAGWYGDCQGTSTCEVQMDTYHFVGAVFQPAPKVQINGTGYLTLNFAYSAADPVATIQTLDGVLTENLDLSEDKNITLQGGYNPQYSARSGMPTVLSGSLIIRNGQLTVDQLAIK